MLGRALYFPQIDIDDPIWIRSAALFWDSISTIVPAEIEDPYRTEDSRICSSEGYLQPLRCDLQSGVIEDLGKKVAPLFHRRESRAFYENKLTKESFEAAKSYAWQREWNYDGIRIHVGKLSAEVVFSILNFMCYRIGPESFDRPALRDAIYAFKCGRTSLEELPEILGKAVGAKIDEVIDGRWLLVDSSFADAYMTALATQLASANGLVPLASSTVAHGISCRFLFDDVVSDDEHAATGVLVSVAARALQMDPSVPMAKLLRFKRKRKEQFEELSASFASLAREISGDAGGADRDGARWLHEAAARLYQLRIEPELRSLKRELAHDGIQALWEGAYKAITVSLPAAGAFAYFTGLSGQALLGAGAALAVTDIGVRRHLSARRRRAANGFSYLLDARTAFGLPEFTDNP